MAVKIGDIVQLKSGGPPMTVTATMGAGKFRCSWFAGAKHDAAVFPEAVLEPAEAGTRKAKAK